VSGGAPGFNDWLGLRPGADESEVRLTTRTDHEVAPGVVHFAVLATLGEVAAAAAVGTAVVPVAVDVQLLERAAPGELVGRGTLLRRGGRLAFARGEVFQGERRVAAVAVTFARI
jgi:acyl-coenzyme A thioesterase PaaI-like protein